MRRVLIAYFSATSTTEKMAGYIAEGVRFSGQEAVTKRIENIKTTAEIAGYDGYILGSPTYSLNVPESMKTFLIMALDIRAETVTLVFSRILNIAFSG